MAVAIWDHSPDEAELLERRLADGWRPRATPTRDGDLVLGYAACLADPGVGPAGAGRTPRPRAS